MTRSQKTWIGALTLLAVGLVVRSWLGIYYPSVYWADEIFQTLEQAHRVVFGPGIEPWEYKDGLRSWLFPGLLAGVMWVGQIFGDTAWGYLSFTTIFLSAVSLIPALVAYLWADREFDDPWWPLLAMAIPVVWFDIIYFGPKALYETFTAHLVVGAIFLVRFAGDRWFQAAAGGLILGLCIVSRPHLAPVAVVVGLAVPLFADDPHRRFSALTVGVVVGFGIGGALDFLIYDKPFHSLIVNLHTNLIEEKASDWGTSPKWQYAVWLWEASPVGAVMMGTALAVGVVRYPTLAWPALAILAAHSMIPHKEYRFIYPTIVLAITISGLEAARLGRWIAEKFEFRFAGPILAVVLGLFVTGVSAYGGMHFNLRSTGDKGEVTNWQHHRGKLLAYRYLSTRDDVCGVGRMQFPWWETGGYTYLHHDIPVVPIHGEGDMRRHSASLDAFVAANWEREMFGRYKREACFRNICVYIRPGECTAEPPDRGL